MQMQNHTGILFVNHFLVIGFYHNSEEQTFYAERRLDDIGNVSFIGLGVKVIQRFTAGVDVLGEVIIGSVRHAPEFAPAEREQIFKVGSCLGIETEFFRIVVTQTEIFLFDIKGIEPVTAKASPVIEPL